MAFQQNPHITTTCYCCSQTTSSPQPPPLSPPCTTVDPYLISAIVSHLQQIPLSYSHHFRPPTTTTFTLPQSNPHQPQPQPQQTNQFHPFFITLIQRIDALEASLHQFSSTSDSKSSSFPRSSVRDAAARTIQSHFRSFLVRRSTTLRHLNQLASIKSALASLNSSFSHHGSVDFDFFSHKAIDLLQKLDSIQSGNKMIRDSRKAVSKEIVEFLELVDGACVKRQQLLLTRKLKMVRNHSGAIPDKKHSAGPKCRNVGGEESKLMASLRERVEKIGRMSKALEEQEQELDVLEDAEYKDIKNDEDEVEDAIRQIASKYRMKNGQIIKKNALSTNGKKRVCFVEDGNMIRVYDIDGDSGNSSRLVDVIEDCTKATHDEEEAQSDGEGDASTHSSEDLRKGASDEVSEDCDDQNEDFTFSTTPEPPKKMGNKADFLSRKPGLKIVGK